MNFRLISTCKLIALIAVISLASCKKDATSANTEQTNAANLTDSSTTADNMYYDVLNTAMVSFADNSDVWNVSATHSGNPTTMSTKVLGSGHIGCAVYTFDNSVPGEYPKTLTVDFGEGCTSADGISRSGIVTFLFSGPIVSPGTTVGVTFTNYKVAGYGIQGQYSITNNSSDQVGISINTQVTNGIITYPNTINYHYSHNKTYIQTAGASTPFDISDDVWAVSGTSSFTSSEGNTLVFTANPLAPLEKKVSCSNISKGIVAFTYNQTLNGSIDFGDGTCDKIAWVTIGNQHAMINLR
jgi:hypothetical protein